MPKSGDWVRLKVKSTGEEVEGTVQAWPAEGPVVVQPTGESDRVLRLELDEFELLGVIDDDESSDGGGWRGQPEDVGTA